MVRAVDKADAYQEPFTIYLHCEWSVVQTSAPKKWTTKDGKGIELDTPDTLRARNLRDIYNSINMKHVTQDERLDVLLTLKHTVKVTVA